MARKNNHSHTPVPRNNWVNKKIYLIFFAENPFLDNTIGVDKIQQDLLQALKIELKHNHPKQRYTFPNLVMMMTDLRQVVEAFGQNLHIGVLDKSKDLVDTAPLIKEMFNL